MALKTDEKTLARKKEYYKKNKDKILSRKKERKVDIYVNKINRNMSSDKEFEKEFMRKLSRLDNIKESNCKLCNVAEEDLDHKLELHHMSYEDTEGVWVCKPCHAELDSLRRREEK